MTELPNPVLAAIHQAVADDPTVDLEQLLAALRGALDNPEAVADAMLTASIQLADQEGGEFTKADIVASTDAAISVASGGASNAS